MRQLVRKLVHTSLLQIATIRFTCRERKICSTVKNSEDVMSMVVAEVKPITIDKSSMIS